MCRLLVVVVPAVVGCSPESDVVDEDGDGFSTQQGDCDDSDPTVGPDAAEVPFDAVDQNCDPSDDAQLEFERISDSDSGPRPGGPRFARDGDLVQLYVVYASESTNESAWSRATFDGSSAELESDEFDTITSDTLPITLGRTLDAAVRPGGVGLVASSIVTSEGNLRASLLELDEEGGWRWAGNGPTGTTDHFADTAIDDDGDLISLVGCGSEGIRWLSGTLTEFFDLAFVSAISEEEVEACEVLGSEVRALHDDGTVVSYSPEGEELVAGGDDWTAVADLQWNSEGFLLVQDDVLVFEDGSDSDVLPTSEVPARARFDVAPDEQLFVVYANEAGDVFLLWGPLGGPFTESFLGEELAKADLDVEATRHALFVAARSGSDAWMAAAERPD